MVVFSLDQKIKEYECCRGDDATCNWSCYFFGSHNCHSFKTLLRIYFICVKSFVILYFSQKGSERLWAITPTVLITSHSLDYLEKETLISPNGLEEQVSSRHFLEAN